MKAIDLAKARAEVGDPTERALYDLIWVGRRLLGVVLLAESLEGPVTLAKLTEKAKRDSEAAQAKLSGINDAIAAADLAHAEQVATFEAERRERERTIAGLEHQMTLGTAAKESKRLAETRKLIAEATAELEAKQGRIAALKATMAALAAEGA